MEHALIICDKCEQMFSEYRGLSPVCPRCEELDNLVQVDEELTAKLALDLYFTPEPVNTEEAAGIISADI